jgi:hypothetical protein
MKLDANGNITWLKTYDTNGDEAHSVQPTADGGYILGGQTHVSQDQGDARLLKLDASGNIVWHRTYNGVNEDDINEVLPTADGGYIATGNVLLTGSSSYWDAWVLKLDASGDITWQNIYRGSNVHSVAPTGDGGYILAFSANTGAEGGGSWLLKLDANGNSAWLYVRAANAPVDVARDPQSVQVLADVLISTLARIASACGTSGVAGDAIRRLGGFI